MIYYPILLNIKHKNCLVVGGGGVGERKAITLMTCGANVSVVSIDFTDRLIELEKNNRLTLIKRPYQQSDLTGVFLVIGATNNESINTQIYHDAQQLNILCNIADKPEWCNFILPSIVRRDDLIIAVSTSGKSPALAKKIRKELEKQYGNEYALFLKFMGAIRKKLLSREHAPEAHKPIFEKLINSRLIELIQSGNIDEINSILWDILGQDFEFNTLMKEAD